ncbi:hypothetical protein HNY73_011702, partial [Argiope bruennichi]
IPFHSSLSSLPRSTSPLSRNKRLPLRSSIHLFYSNLRSTTEARFGGTETVPYAFPVCVHENPTVSHNGFPAQGLPVELKSRRPLLPVPNIVDDTIFAES